MKGISVEYLDHCGSDEAIANSARVSFGDFRNWNEIPEGYSKERCDKLIDYLGRHKHTTPFRQNSITIRCSAPIFLTRQLMKHSVGMTWNEESRRYIDTQPTFFIPDQWRSRPEKSLKQGSGNGVVEWLDRETRVGRAYQDAVDTCLSLYNEMLEANVAPEMARMVLPQSMIVNWVWTGSLLSFSHLYNLRIKENAQVEARVFADKLDKVIAPLFPVAWESLKEQQ